MQTFSDASATTAGFKFPAAFSLMFDSYQQSGAMDTVNQKIAMSIKGNAAGECNAEQLQKIIKEICLCMSSYLQLQLPKY